MANGALEFIDAFAALDERVDEINGGGHFEVTVEIQGTREIYELMRGCVFFVVGSAQRSFLAMSIGVYDVLGHFVCHATYVRTTNGDTFAVCPDMQRAYSDEEGTRLIPTRRSVRHGYRVCSLNRDDIVAHEVSDELPIGWTDEPCEVTMNGSCEQRLGFVSWYGRTNGAMIARFVQFGDARLNGLPVLSTEGKLVGMYMCRTWMEAPAECVPCDVMFNAASPGPRCLDITAERSAESYDGLGFVIPRAVELDEGWVFTEMSDGRARWVQHVTYPEIVYENERKWLKRPFDEVVRDLGLGLVEWSDATTTSFSGFVCWGFSPPEPIEAQTTAIDEYVFPCRSWW